MKTPFLENLQVAFFKGIGHFLATVPSIVPRCLSIAVGDFIYFAPTSLRRIVLSNLHHAFPEKDKAWQKKVARESCRRTIELGLFVLASPFISQDKLRKSFIISDFYRESIAKGGPYVILVPHFSGVEAITLTSLLFDGPIPQTGVIYRPFDNRALERYVKDTRERGGVVLLSRKEGFTRAMEMLRRGSSVAILFDQNAGRQGALTLFFDRLASTSELPGLLAQRFKCKTGVLYTQRTGFWKAEMRAEVLECETEAHSVTLTANQWLENKLKNEPEVCADWLWLHRRWKTQTEPEVCLQLFSSRNILDKTMQARGLTELPKRTRLWIRMPNWLGDVMMALPLIRAIREGRPDMSITLLAAPAFVPLLKALSVAEHVHALPSKGLAYFKNIFKWRYEYIDRLIIFTNSLRSDIESCLLNPEASHGMVFPGRRRYFLTHPWHLPCCLPLTTTHQLDVWTQWLKTLGLQVPANCIPFSLQGAVQKNLTIALIAGSENAPEKRWPINYWRELIGHLLLTYPKHQIVLLGTIRDSAIATQIIQGFDPIRVQDLTGKTNLINFAKELESCELVISNDTGGAHLSNALGTPTLVLFGPTNPLRTAPVYKAPLALLQPVGCPAAGGANMTEILPAAVLQSCKVLVKPLTH